MSETIITAAILVIGDEILSGRTKDRNIGYIAEYLTNIGVDVREARVVPDIEEEIVAALNALRGRYDYVFTTGGIGPTHDDITADAVAKAFGVEIDEDPRVTGDDAGALQARRADAGAPAHGAHSRTARNWSRTRFRRRRAFASAMSSSWRACPRSCRRCSTRRPKTLETGVRLTGRDDRGGRIPRGALRRRAGRDRRRASRDEHRLLSLISPTESSTTRSSCAAATRSRSPRRAARSRRCWPVCAAPVRPERARQIC